MPNPHTAIEAVTRRRFLVSGWPWRAVAYLLTTGPVALAVAVPMVLLGLPWALLVRRIVIWDDPSPAQLAALLLGGGLLVVGVGPLVALPTAAVERRRLRLVDTRPARSGHRPVPAGGPGRPWPARTSRPRCSWPRFASSSTGSGHRP